MLTFFQSSAPLTWHITVTFGMRFGALIASCSKRICAVYKRKYQSDRIVESRDGGLTAVRLLAMITRSTSVTLQTLCTACIAS